MLRKWLSFCAKSRSFSMSLPFLSNNTMQCDPSWKSSTRTMLNCFTVIMSKWIIIFLFSLFLIPSSLAYVQCEFCYQKMKIPNIFFIFALLSPSPSASPSLSFSSFMEAQKINKVQLLKRTWKPLDLQLWECNMSRFPISWQPTLPNSPVELLSLRLIALHS